MSAGIFLCGVPSAVQFPDVECGNCYASAFGRACTCWEPVFNVEQAPADTSVPGSIGPDGGCDDCAYRADSPEKQGSDLVNGDADELQWLVELGTPFWCHKGLRQPVAYRHPSGLEFVPPGIEHNYQPLIVGSKPYKADGTPADLCGGWVQRRVMYLREETT